METLNVGFTLMIIGMSTVFVFLIIMIFAMNLSAKVISIINKYFPEDISETKKTSKIQKNTNNDAEIALAIACAIGANKRNIN